MTPATEVQSLRERVAELEAALSAVAEGAVDALVLPGRTGPQIYTLGGADASYRVVIEELDQGIALLGDASMILYANRALADMTGIPLTKLVGMPLLDAVAAESERECAAAFASARRMRTRQEIRLTRPDGATRPVLLSITPLPAEAAGTLGVVVTDRSLVERQAATIRESEARYETLIDAADEGIAITTEDGRILKANGAFARLLGFASVSELMREGPAAAGLRKVREAARARASREVATTPIECPIVRRDGSDVWTSALVQIVPPAEAGGEPRVHYFLRDITAERAEREDLARLAAIVRSTAHAIHTTTLDGRIQTWNAGATELYGVPASSAMGRRLEDLVAFARSPESVPSLVSRLERTPRIDPVEIEFSRPDGDVRSAAVFHGAIRDSTGGLSGLVAITTDATDLVRARAGARALDEELQHAQAAAHIGSWSGDVATRLSAWSPEVYHLVGIEPGGPPPTLDSLPAVLSRESRERYEEAVSGAVSRGATFETDLRLDERHGSRWLLAKGAPIQNAEGVVTGLRGTLQDITERKLAEARAEELNVLNEAIVGSLPGMFAVLDPSGGFERCNDYLLGVLGYTFEDLKSLGAFGVVAPEERALAEAELNRVLREGVGNFDAALVAKDGTRIDCVLSGRLITAPEPRVVVIALDVSARKRAEALLRQSERLRTLGTLVAGVAHEINNPLTYINVNLELANLALDAAEWGKGREEEMEGLRGNLATAQKGLARISHIVRSLRVVAKAGAKVRSVENVNGLVEAALPVARPRIGAGIVVEQDLKSRGLVSCDATQISQVLLNLLLNAGEAMEAKQGAIHVSTRDEDEEVVIEIRDEGSGIPEGARARLFTPFFTTKMQGTGLGLSVSLAIIESHGGSLTYETSMGRGTTFRVRLPITAPGA